MNRIQVKACLHTNLCGICVALAITAWGCSDWIGSAPLSAILDSSERTELGVRVPIIREPYRIEITGHNDRWHVRYSDIDGQFADPDEGPSAREVHVPLETDVVLVLKSNDYVYTLELPQFALKEIAVPRLEFHIELHPADAGRFPMLGDQLCGDAHPELHGDLVVEPRSSFLQWLNDRSTQGLSP
jgi:heme/copper-type cytochrome/quinol oxidase subunit 2